MAVRIEHTVTAGTFSLDGGSWQVENNVWLLGDDEQCVLVDAPHAAGPIRELIGDRALRAIVCTHAHDDHITAARELAEGYRAPVLLHPADEVLWRQTYPSFEFTPLSSGETLTIGDVELQVLHTPGHSPGAVSLYVPALGTVFTGDTLFAGGPGATGRSFSDFGTIVDSIRDRLLTLPPATVVHTGHGESTSIGAEAPHLAGWIARGH
ncbi:MAG TPA: MBL fold metallo-hydrolase [Jatrophihabitans sp.]|nr:MBL fold metallo-hydrolase [Jatrophihabitans sp.]